MALPSSVTARLGQLVEQVTALKNNVAINDKLDAALARDSDVAALGRFVATLNPADIGKFRTPSLRNVAMTAPYMHDGSVETLEQAIDVELYSTTGNTRRPVILTAEEKAELAEFLRSPRRRLERWSRRLPTPAERKLELNAQLEISARPLSHADCYRARA